MAAKKQVDAVVLRFYQGWIVDKPLTPGDKITVDAEVAEYLAEKDPPVVEIVKAEPKETAKSEK